MSNNSGECHRHHLLGLSVKADVASVKQMKRMLMCLAQPLHVSFFHWAEE